MYSGIELEKTVKKPDNINILWAGIKAHARQHASLQLKQAEFSAAS
jgi:hypothetical protein